MLIPTTLVQSGSGGYSLIAEVLVDANGLATVDFQNIPAAYRHLHLYFRARSEGGSSADIQLRFNNDSGANYFVEVVRGVAGLASAATLASQTAGNIASVPQTSAAETFDAHGLIKIPYYATGTVDRVAFSEYALSTASGTQVGQFGAYWTGTTAVSRVQLILSTAADFKEGSIFSLYGIT